MATSEKVNELAESYRQLSDEERHAFAELVAPLDDSEISQEWLDEIRSRANGIDTGNVKLIDGDEVLRELRAIQPVCSTSVFIPKQGKSFSRLAAHLRLL